MAPSSVKLFNVLICKLMSMKNKILNKALKNMLRLLNFPRDFTGIKIIVRRSFITIFYPHPRTCLLILERGEGRKIERTKPTAEACALSRN